MTWNAFKDRVETLRTTDEITDEITDELPGDEQEIRLEPASHAADRDSFVRRIKAVLAA